MDIREENSDALGDIIEEENVDVVSNGVELENTQEKHNRLKNTTC